MNNIPVVNTNSDKIIKSLPKGGLSLSLNIVEQSGLKSVRKHISINTPDYDSIRQELDTLNKMRDRRVLILKGYNLIGSNLYIYTEYCPEGDLAQLIAKRRAEGSFIDENEIWIYINDVIKGLLYIHNNGVIHRDLKPANIFISDEHLVIGDFGLAVSANSTTQFYGTPNYVAPELWSDRSPIKKYTQSTDLFAAGCIFYELCTLQMAFPDRDRNIVSHNIVYGKYQPIMQHYSDRLKHLVYALINPNPTYRQNTQYINKYIDTKEDVLPNTYPVIQQPQLLSSPSPSLLHVQTQPPPVIQPQTPPVSTNKFMNAASSSSMQKLYSQNQNTMINNNSIKYGSNAQYPNSFYQNPPSTPYQALSYPSVNYPSVPPQQQFYSQQYPPSSSYPYQTQIPVSSSPSILPLQQQPQQIQVPTNSITNDEKDKHEYIKSNIRMNSTGDLFTITELLSK